MSVAAGTAAGQQTAVPGAPAAAAVTVIGSVFDSIRIRPLAGAVIRVDTSELAITANDNGQFRLEVSPGPHRLRVEHPMLDTLGIALVSPTQNYAAGTTAAVQLATPSHETLINLFCPPAWRARGPAALVGRVRDAGTKEPATGAKVSLVWYEVDVSAGIKRVPVVREVSVSPNGTYRICGLPAQLDGKIQVLHGPRTSGEIAISFGDDLLALRSMSIAPLAEVIATTDSTGAKASVVVLGTARLTGRVLDRSGKPLVGARVQLEGTSRATSTRSNGDFVLDSLPPGTQAVSVRQLGYGPVSEAVDLVSDESRSINIALSDFVPVLAEVRVSAQRERALDNVGFARRKRTGQGVYLDGDRINHTSIYYSDVLRTVPGLRVQPGGNGRSMVTSTRSTSGCVVFWIDGTLWQQLEPGDIDEFLKPHEIAAIEVYNGVNTPVEFQKSAAGGCATVVAWTFRRLDRKR